MNASPSIVVFGSLVYDLTSVAPRFPEPGEAVIGTAFYTSAGGKGGNQAVAVARLGARAAMVGRVGDDAFGRELLESLQRYGVDVSGVGVEQGVSSGVAQITVGPTGQNKIVIVQGANSSCGDGEVACVRRALRRADALLLQLETPLEASLQAARVARAAGKLVIFDPAPVGPLPPEAYRLASFLTPNEVEASALTGFPVTDGETGLRAARTLKDRGCGAAIVTLGGQGVCYAADGDEAYVPAFRVEVLDTVAAGDAFNGALAVALTEGRDLRSAITWAMAAGALAVTRRGAHGAMPSRAEVDAALLAWAHAPA